MPQRIDGNTQPLRGISPQEALANRAALEQPVLEYAVNWINAAVEQQFDRPNKIVRTVMTVDEWSGTLQDNTKAAFPDWVMTFSQELKETGDYDGSRKGVYQVSITMKVKDITKWRE